jgi:hypothetical protein
MIDTELYATFSWDGGRSWAYNGSEGWLEYYLWSGDDVVISDYRSHDLSDDASMSIWEYDASEGGDVLTYLHYSHNTVKVTGDVIDEFSNPVTPDFVSIINYDLETVTNPSISGNTYTQTMLLGFDLWTNLTLRFASLGEGLMGSEYHNFSTIDLVNVVDIIMDGYPGDTDDNGCVDVIDFLKVLAQWGTMGPEADVNFDGSVDVLDFLKILAQWGCG